MSMSKNQPKNKVFVVETYAKGKVTRWRMYNHETYYYMTLEGAVNCAKYFKKEYPDKVFTVKRMEVEESGSYWKF